MSRVVSRVSRCDVQDRQHHRHAHQQEGPAAALPLLEGAAEEVSRLSEPRLLRAPGAVPRGGHCAVLYWAVLYCTVLYYKVGTLLAERGMVVFGHDHIGHGESEGRRAYIENVDHYVDDLVQHCMDMQV